MHAYKHCHRLHHVPGPDVCDSECPTLTLVVLTMSFAGTVCIVCEGCCTFEQVVFPPDILCYEEAVMILRFSLNLS